MRKAKQSTAKNVMVLMVGSTDHVTGKTGLTLTITASKDGGAFSSISPAVTERGNGWYSLALTASHTDTLGDLALHITGAAADPADMVLLVEARSVDDVLPTASYTAPDNATIAAIALYTDSIESRLPAALVGGRMDSSVGAMAVDVITAAALAADAVAEIQAGLAVPGDSMALTPAAIDAILDEVVDGGYTVRQLLRGYASALMAKLSGADINLPVFRDVGDTKDRISAVTDAAGNRTAVTLDLT